MDTTAITTRALKAGRKAGLGEAMLYSAVAEEEESDFPGIRSPPPRGHRAQSPVGLTWPVSQTPHVSSLSSRRLVPYSRSDERNQVRHKARRLTFKKFRKESWSAA